jgi:hypothetical protein
MRAPQLLLILVLAGCSHAEIDAPSLAPRPEEAIDPRVPVPEPAISMAPGAGLVDQLDLLVAQAQSGDRAFQPLAERARQLAESAGARESESWIAAQQALSAAVAARAPVATAVADIQALGAHRIQSLGGIAAGDLMAIDTAAARAGTIDSREASTIDQIQALLAR